MGRKSGQRGKPTKLKLLQGVTREDKLNRKEPEPEILYIDPPKHLSRAAKRFWKHFFGICFRMNVITEADVMQLEIFCNACADERELTMLIAKEGYMVEEKRYDKEGNLVCTKEVAHPAMRLLKTARDSIDKYGGALALNPQDRSRMQIEGKGKGKEPEGIEAFIG
jgi:P27 family predicted phage terminase small subunit